MNHIFKSWVRGCRTSVDTDKTALVQKSCDSIVQSFYIFGHIKRQISTALCLVSEKVEFSQLPYT